MEDEFITDLAGVIELYDITMARYEQMKRKTSDRDLIALIERASHDCERKDIFGRLS